MIDNEHVQKFINIQISDIVVEREKFKYRESTLLTLEFF